MDAAMEHMRGEGVSFVLDEPAVHEDHDYYGEQFAKIRLNWTHPRTTRGLLIELQEFTK
jgi:hypothetical protein